MKNKKGQLTIWIIVAIAVVVAIIIFFLLNSKIKPEIVKGIEENPNSFIRNCVNENINNIVDIILPQGGFASPEHFKLYNGINISYLCYNSGNYYPCVNEHPMLINEIANEINTYIFPRIDECFQNYKLEMGKRGNEVELGIMELDIELGRGRIYTDIDRKIIIKNNEESKSFEEFNFEIINPIYDLARVAMEIASQEAKYCYFEYVGYIILYPRFNIRYDSLPDGTEIYSIKDKKSGKEMNMAIRSCAIPPGF